MRSSNEWDSAEERTHSWGDETPDPDWLEEIIQEIEGRVSMEKLLDELAEDPDEPVFKVDMASLIRLGELTPKSIKFLTRLKRRLELGGSSPISKFPDLVPKMKRSKPLGCGKVDSVKLTP
jgi:hypothetical protein